MTRHRGQRRSALIASRAKKLNVTADQTTKVHALILAREQKKNELRQQYKGQDKTAWKDQLKQSHDQFIDGMKATLTPEQFEKLEQQKRQRRLTFHFMRETSRFGDWPAHFALGLFLAGIAWWRGSKKWTRIFLSMLIALGIAGVVGRGIQMATGRARPSVRTEEVWNGARFNPKYQAFPSGHVGASTAFFGVLFLANRRIGLACLSIPILIGFSRIYLGALSVRRGLRCGSWISLRSAYGTAFSSRNRKSAIENRKLDGGGGEIRTHEAFRPAGFQDRCNQPLCHPSRNRSGSTCPCRAKRAA